MRDGPRGLAVPRGFRDILPTEARELHAIERQLMAAFAAYGYVPLEPPAVEFAADALTVDERRVLRFIDRDGRLLALRPDVTTAVARVVAQRYRESDAALRLAYFTPVFREEPSMRGSEREYDQAGVELIGARGARADAEIIGLLGDALARCGLAGAEIDVGHVGYVGGFFAELPEGERERAAERARAGDLVGALETAGARLPKARLAALERGVRHRGDIDDPGLDGDAPASSRHALEELRALEPLLEAAGVGAAVRFDLGYLPSLPYYSGVVFQVTTPDLGFPIAAGGRYDGLLGRYGADRPATGFGIAVPHLHQAIVAAGWRAPDEGPLVVLVASASDIDTLRAATALRSSELAVAIDDVAETAGQRVVRAKVIDERTVEFEGRHLELEAFVTAVRS